MSEIEDSIAKISSKRKSKAHTGALNTIPVDILLQRAFDGIIAINSELNILSLSTGAELLFGYTEDELLGQQLAKLLPKRYVEHHQEYVAEFLQSTDVIRPLSGGMFEVVGRHKDGLDIPLEAIVCKYSSAAANKKSIVTSILIRDIGTRRRAEISLQQYEAYFRTLVEDSSDAIMLFSPDGVRRYISPSAENVFGLAFNTLESDLNMSYLHPDDVHVMKDAVKIIADNSAQTLTITYRVRQNNGDWRWIEGVLKNLCNDPRVGAIVVNNRNVTERILAEQARQESENRFRKLFHGVPIPGGLTRLSDGTFLDVNNALTEFTGWNRDEMIGKTSLELGLWLNGDQRKIVIEKIMSGEAIRNAEIPIRIRSGEIRNTLTSVYAMQLGDDPCLLVTNTDVTEQMRAVSVIKRHNRLLNTLSAVNKLLLQESDSQQLFEETCRVIVEEAGFRLAWIGIADIERGIITPVAKAGIGTEYLSKITVRCDNSPAGRGPSGTAIRENRTVVCTDTDTDPRYAIWRERANEHGFRSSAALPLRQRDRVFGCLNIYSNYVNNFGPDELPLLERMSSDLGFVYERLAMQKALQESESRLASFFTEAPAGLVLYDKDSRFLQVNPTLARTGNFDAQSILGKLPSDILPQPMASFIEDSVRSVYESGVARVNEETTGRLPSESTEVRHWMHSHFPVRNSQGGVYAVGGFVVETTLLKNAEDALKQINQELELRVQARTEELTAANEELESFAYSVSHDLRAPLRTIDGFSRIIMEDYVDIFDDEGRRNLHRIVKAVGHMGAIIDALLALARLSHQELKLQHIRGEQVMSMVKDIINEIELENSTTKIDWQIAQLSSCFADHTLLRQVWFNLLRNAVKYSGRKDTPKVSVGVRAEGGEIIYYVRDNGVGFDMNFVNKLFSVFQRLHVQDDFEGIGIGLATVKRIIGMLGGRVWAEGEVDNGATFYFALPEKSQN